MSWHGPKCFGITAEPSSLSLDEICEAQAADDNLQLVIQALVEGVKPPHGSLRNYPEEARILFSQWDSLVLEESILYRRYHYPDGTTQCHQGNDSDGTGTNLHTTPASGAASQA